MKASKFRFRHLAGVSAGLFTLLSLAPTASADEVQKVQGDGVCPTGWMVYPYEAALENQSYVCGHLEKWDIARISEQSSMSGHGYKCEIKAYDDRVMGHTLCEPAPTPPSVSFDTNQSYLLKTQFRGDEECLEGNALDRGRDGGAFMSPCEPYTGQLFRLHAATDGYYRLKTVFRGEGECLESNKASNSFVNGAAHMAPCKNVTGQYWRFEDLGNGYVRMKSLYRGDDECLEGNGPDGIKGGLAYMTECENLTGQFWELVPYR